MTFIIIFIWTLTAFAQECRGQITVTQIPSITAEQPGGTVNIKCKTSRDVQRWSGAEGLSCWDPKHITESWYQLFLVHLEQMEEGVGPGVLAEEAEELSQEEGAGELGAQALVFEWAELTSLVLWMALRLLPALMMGLSLRRMGGADESGAVDGSETVAGPNDGTESAQK
ncbi:unnamed protein product [Leuciscus chuanchicus]